MGPNAGIHQRASTSAASAPALTVTPTNTWAPLPRPIRLRKPMTVVAAVSASGSAR